MQTAGDEERAADDVFWRRTGGDKWPATYSGGEQPATTDNRRRVRGRARGMAD
jgi:hypothetical protein